MQIAKEPLLYHLRAAGGETGRPSGVGRGRAGKGTLLLWQGTHASGESPQCQVPSKPRGSASLLYCSKSGLADGNHLLSLLLEGLGDSEAAKKILWTPRSTMEAQPPIKLPGVHSRFVFPRVSGSSVSVSRIWKRVSSSQ